MSKIDKIKEKIGLMKFWLGVIVALIISDSSWLINNFSKKSDFLFICGIFNNFIYYSSLNFFKIEQIYQ